MLSENDSAGDCHWESQHLIRCSPTVELSNKEQEIRGDDK